MVLKKVARWFIPGVETAEDGREKWPSRLSFILAGMGSAVGLGNLLRYPSVVYPYYGLQWFVPYLVALFLVGLPLLLLEIAMGQNYRGGSVVALGRVSPRLGMLGFAAAWIGITVATYYAVILAWVMVYLRNSFISPLPWTDRGADFFDEAVANVPSVTNSDGSVSYPGEGIVGETYGWNIFVWTLVLLAIFKGVSLTGRVVYITMTVPLVMMLILLVRAVTLEGAGNGVKLYVGVWRSGVIGEPGIWQAAIGQIFFSIGTGYAIYFAYSSYNSAYQNAVQDSIIIALSNSLFEVVAGFAAFGMIGHLNLELDAKLSTFTLGFITYPEALARLPGGNVWSVFFFIMLMLLGVDSAFALTESFITIITDAQWAQKLPRSAIVLTICCGSLLFGLLYSARGFGLAALDVVDKYTNEMGLLFVAMCQCIFTTTLYRWHNVADQVGKLAFSLFNASYLGGMIIGLIVAFHAPIWAGVVTWLAIWIVGFTTATLVGKDPTADGAWVRANARGVAERMLSRFWWLSLYSGNQLARDLNVTVATGKNWRIPGIWPFVLRWVTTPVLLITLSLITRDFNTLSSDPIKVLGFVMGLLPIIFSVIGFFFPVLTAFFLPSGGSDRWKEQYLPPAGVEVSPEKHASMKSGGKDAVVVASDRDV